MPRKSELVRLAEVEISTRETNIKRLDAQIMKQKAEIKAYKDMIEWQAKVGRKSSGTKSSTNTK